MGVSLFIKHAVKMIDPLVSVIVCWWGWRENQREWGGSECVVCENKKGLSEWEWERAQWVMQCDECVLVPAPADKALVWAKSDLTRGWEENALSERASNTLRNHLSSTVVRANSICETQWKLFLCLCQNHTSWGSKKGTAPSAIYTNLLMLFFVFGFIW